LAKPWAEVEKDPDFLGLPEPEQVKVRQAYVSRAEQDPVFQGLPPQEQERVRARIMPPAPAPAGPSLVEKAGDALKQGAQAAGEALIKPIGKGLEKAAEMSLAQERAAEGVRLPILARASEIKEELPGRIAETVSRAAARHGLAAPELFGVHAAAPAAAVDALIPSVRTAKDAEIQAAAGMLMAGGERVARAVPVLNKPVGELWAALTRRGSKGLKAPAPASAAAPQAAAAAPEPAPPAQGALARRMGEEPTTASLEAAIPEAMRPGQVGAINPGGVTKKPATKTPVLDDLAEMHKHPVDERTIAEHVRDAGRAVQESQQDYLAPLKRFVALAEEKRGAAFTAEENAYIQGSLLPGAQGIVEAEIRNFEKAITPVARRGLDTDLDNFLTLVQFKKRAQDLTDRMGRAYASGDPDLLKDASEIGARLAANKVNPRSFDIAKADRGLAELQAKLGPEKFAYLEKKAGEIWQQNRQMLDMLRDAGLVSKQGHQAIVDRGLNYTPIQVLDYIDEGLKGSSSTRKLSMEYQDVIRRMQGTEKDVRGALPATYDYIARAVTAAERNKIGQKVVAMRGVPGMEGLIKKVNPFEKVPKDMEPFYVFENGVRQTYAVPKDVGTALAGMGTRELGFLEKVLQTAGGTFKAGATTANIEFAIPGNVFRDFYDAMILPKSGLRARNPKEALTLASQVQTAQFVSDFLKAFFHTVRRDDVYQEVLRSKALYSTLQKGITPEAFVAGLRKQPVERTLAQKMAGFVPKILNVLEETPKVATYQRARRAGMSPAESAYDASIFGGSPDFLRRGTSTPSVNLLYMFYTGKVQGTARILEAMKNNRSPKETAFLMSTMAGVPAVSLYLWNQQFDDYHRLDKSERFNNAIIMLPGESKNAQGQRIPRYIKRPKTEIEKAIHGSIEAALDHYNQVVGRDGMQTAVDIITSFSPLNLSVDLKDPAKSAGASLMSGLNPMLKVPGELVSNYDFFRQRPIDSRSQEALHSYARGKDTTTETAKLLGRVTSEVGPDGVRRGGLSPNKIQHAVGGFTGGVGRQVLDVSDAILRRMGKADPAPPAADAYEAAQRIPILRRMVGRYEPRAEVADLAMEFEQGRRMDKSTAKAVAAQAIGSFIKDRSDANREQMRQALREAASVDPEIVGKAVDAAIKHQARGNMSLAYDVFDAMSPQDQALFIKSLSKSEDGLALRAQLQQEFRRRRR
jgi:hypothetical protein